MRRLGRLVVVFVLLTLGAAPAAAQTDGQDVETVTKTFELTLYGDAPEGETFRVFWDIVPNRGTSRPLPVYLCGELADAPCVGGGRVYTGSVEVRAGTTIEFEFIRFGAGRLEDRFFSGTETLDADMTNTAYYDFGTAGDGAVPDDMPDTGAGALAADGVPAVPAAGALALSAVGGYAAVRRRRGRRSIV